jgi:hypothetical protein
VARREDPLEQEAKRVMQRLHGGRVVDRDEPPAQGMRDFDLVDDEETRHAVEVTSVQLASVGAARSGMERLRHDDIGLTQSWSVTVHETADLRPVRGQAPALLNELAVLGVQQFGLHRHDDPIVNELVGQLRAVGVVHGHGLPSSTPPRLLVSGYGSGSIDPSNVTVAVEAELDKDDNQRKLGAAPDGATRHLFVWLHDSHWYVSSTLRGDDFPLPPAPLLPAEVDVVWIGTASGPGSKVDRLLRADRYGIQDVDPDTGRPLTPQSPPTSAADGPPGLAGDCPACGAVTRWEMATHTRHDPEVGTKREIAAWDSTCSNDQAHYRSPGRALSRRELQEHIKPPSDDAVDRSGE